MSTDYTTEARIAFADLFDGRLERFGIRQHVTASTSDAYRCLTDGTSYVWANAKEDGSLGCISRYGGNNPGRILGVIEGVFQTAIFSEYEPQFWGFKSEKEWHSAMEAMAKEHDDKWYQELCRYLRDESNSITPGTVGEQRAQIARELVDQNPELLMPVNKDRLLAQIDEVSARGNLVTLPAELMASIESAAALDSDARRKAREVAQDADVSIDPSEPIPSAFRFNLRDVQTYGDLIWDQISDIFCQGQIPALPDITDTTLLVALREGLTALRVNMEEAVAICPLILEVFERRLDEGKLPIVDPPWSRGPRAYKG